MPTKDAYSIGTLVMSHLGYTCDVFAEICHVSECPISLSTSYLLFSFDITDIYSELPIFCILAGVAGDWKNKFTIAQNEAFDKWMKSQVKDTNSEFPSYLDYY